MHPLRIFGILILGLLLHWQSIADEMFQTSSKDAFLKSIYTTKNGLPQNSPNEIVQTQDGYLWLATFGGLARFDGVKFTVFNTSNTPELVNNRIIALHEDFNGVLWIGSEDGDLINYKDGVFSLIKKSKGTPIDNTINALYLDQNEILWIATNYELRTYNTKTKEFSVYAPSSMLKPEVLQKSTATNEIFRADRFAKDSDGSLWIATNKGLVHFSENKFTHFDTADGLPENVVYSVHINPNGGLWIATSKNVGVYQNKIFTKFAESKIERGFSNLAVSREKHLFFTAQNLLYEVIGNEVKTYPIEKISIFGIKPLVFDKQDNLWFGSATGLIQLKKREIELFAVTEGDSWRGTSAIVESSDKSIWIASGSYLINWKDGIFKSNFFSSNNNILSLALDKNSNLFIGTEKGLYQFKDNQFVKIPDIEPNLINSIFFDQAGTLWFGMKAIGLYKQEAGGFKKFTTEDGLANNWISFLMQDRKGAIWIGNRGGVSRLENGKFTNYTSKDGLLSENVREIYEDEEGTIWIGTYGGGISRLRDGKIVSITAQEGLAEDIVSRILADENGLFWILGNQGIYTVSRKSLNDFADGKLKRVYCTVYDEKDGMDVAEGSGGNSPAGLRASNGRLWFPLIRGGIVINPIKPNLTSPPVYIENVLLQKQLVNPQKKLEIQPDQSNLEISYTAVSFSKPEQIQFRYKLEDYDSDWQDVGTRRVAYYPYLPPGTYTFRVMATNGNDVWSETPASLEIVVHAPFWRTWWFLALSILALVLLIIFIYQWRLTILKRRRLRQEEFSRQLINSNEAERNRIAGELHDGLGQNLLVIRNWTLLLLKQVPEDAKYRKQLEEIADVTSQSLEETRNMTRNLRPQHIQRFGLTETLKNMIEQVEESSQLSFETEIENFDKLFSAEEELSIYRIVQESLHNLVKFSKATNSKIIISRISGSIDFTNPQDKLMIKIIDDGKDFDWQSNQDASFGADNIIQRVQLLGGKYSIKSLLGRGTEFTIYLNIKEQQSGR